MRWLDRQGYRCGALAGVQGLGCGAEGMSKAAKKNAARKAKKAAEATASQGVAGEASASQGVAAADVEAVTEGVAAVGVSAQEPEDEAEAVRKRIRALRKKVRLCEEQVEKVTGRGETRSEDLLRKEALIPEWCALPNACLGHQI